MSNNLKTKRNRLFAITICSMLAFGLILVLTGMFNGLTIRKTEIEDLTEDVPLTFSAESGFYEEPILLEITAPEGTDVYYTLDSTDPDEGSILYTEPIYLEDATQHENVYSMRTDVSAGFYTDLIELYHPADGNPEYVAPDFLVDKCNIVRAIAIREDGQKSGIVTKTYFVGLTPEEFDGVNFVSVTTDPSNLFDPDKGIYVTGTAFENYMTRTDVTKHWRFWDANYRMHGKEWERSATVTFFDKNGHLTHDQQYAAIRTQGGISRGTVPRSLNLYAKNTLGKNNLFDFELFSSDFIPHAVTLTCGGDMLWTKFNDYMMSMRCENLNFATMKYEPYVLFLDGEYWGFYWLAEKYDEHFISHYYNVDPDNICMVKNEQIGCGDDSAISLYYKMRYEILNRDLSQQNEYEYICSIIDVDSFLDYYATMAYISRQEDWPHSNVALWRSLQSSDDAYADGRWRWMLFDCNSVSMSADIVNDNSLEYIIENDELFASLWNNSEFREKFKTRILWIAESCFNAEDMLGFIDNYDSSMKEVLRKSWTRFHGSQNNKLEDYEYDMDGYRIFFSERKAVVESWFLP